jgi:ADP-ribose pyrophosphatase YjhB (NUDIX family)
VAGHKSRAAQRVCDALAVLPWLLRIWRRLPGPLKFLYLRLRYGRFAVGVAALIRDERGRVLIVHRTYSVEEPWALPGGWLEGQETIEHTLERELLEETSLHVRVGPLLAVDRTRFVMVVLLAAELIGGSSLEGFRASAEVSELAWIELRDVGRLSPFTARLLHRALR